MPWTESARREHRRKALRYASDMTDREGALIEPFMPPRKRLGRPRTTNLREVVKAILHIATTGCRWAMLPKDLPPYSTVQRYFYDWRDSGLLHTIRFNLAMETRELEGREAQPTAGVIDSQTVKTTESGGIRGYDAGKKINGRKRHAVVDTIGLLFGLVVHAADIQDRDGAPRRSLRSADRARGSGTSSPTAAARGPRSAARATGSASGRSRSSSAPIRRRASRSCPEDGSWRGPSPGLDGVADWPETGKNQSPPPRPGSTSPTSA